jgi:hypothetical protein
MAFDKEGLKATSVTVGLGMIAGSLLGSWMGREKFDEVAGQEVDKYAAGQEFDREQFVLDTLTRPVDRAAMEAVVRGGLRQYGEEDATQPSPEARAVVLCAGAAANKLVLDDETNNNLIVAARFEDTGDDEAAERAYNAAADGCQTVLDGALGGEGNLVFPVDDK